MAMNLQARFLAQRIEPVEELRGRVAEGTIGDHQDMPAVPVELHLADDADSIHPANVRCGL